MRRRRDSTKVIHDILKIAKGKASRTQIVYQGNLNFKFAERYLTFLVDKGLIQPKLMPGSVTLYELTTQGEDFLDLLSRVESELVDLFHGPKDELVWRGSASLVQPSN